MRQAARAGVKMEQEEEEDKEKDAHSTEESKLPAPSTGAVTNVDVDGLDEMELFWVMTYAESLNYELSGTSASEADTLFRRCSPELVRDIVASPSMPWPEVELFKCCVSWAKNRLKAQGVAEPSGPEIRAELHRCGILYELRFGRMKVGELASVVVPTGVLTEDELLLLYQFSAAQDSQASYPVPPELSNFNMEHRLSNAAAAGTPGTGGLFNFGVQRHKPIECATEVFADWDGQPAQQLQLAVPSMPAGIPNSCPSDSDSDDYSD